MMKPGQTHAPEPAKVLSPYQHGTVQLTKTSRSGQRPIGTAAGDVPLPAA
jgi:hypothetical protein